MWCIAPNLLLNSLKTILMTTLNQLTKQIKYMLEGRRFTILAHGEVFRALLCRNVKPNELPWRVSWFNVSMIPQPHIAIDELTAKKIMNGVVPEVVMTKLNAKLGEVEIRFEPPHQ